MTFGLHRWFIFNQFVVQAKTTVEILLLWYNFGETNYYKYTLTTITAQAFVLASFVQLLEWHLIASMVKF